jgi:hypothetical protein
MTTKYLKPFFLFFIVMQVILSGQILHPINQFPASSAKKKEIGIGQTVNILAVMVEFQPSDASTITGNGQFDSIYTKNWGKDIIDPLPHDSAYFAAHLKFASNYFKNVSNNKLNVTYTVLPKVITVSKTMKDYSPLSGSTDFTGLADFVAEVWHLVDSLNPGLNFSDYDLFTVFHAGVGRDVSVSGSLGNERDLPSVYMNLTSLQKYLSSSYAGISVSNGNFHITNSLILPQTENREATANDNSKYLYQITINGLLVSSIGSHIGLPDLFDTKTGVTAIGRLGLMDGQGIFAYNGVFPPAPSAWEKIKLGWVTPVEITPGDFAKLNLKTYSAASSSDTMIYKIPLNAQEYYLVENRQRDPNATGVTLTIYNNGTSSTKTFAKDTTGFYSNNIDSLSGVITDVDNPDWALPGNGILIWHVDESIVNSKIATDEINADKNNRGIMLEEADGIRDIGQQYTDVFGDVVTGEGEEVDFWYAANDAKLFKNIFNNTSRPNTLAHSGASSLIAMKNFSALGKTMSFALTYGTDDIKPIVNKKLTLPSTDNTLFYDTLNNAGTFVIQSGDSLFLYDSTFTVLQVLPDFSSVSPAIGKNCIIGVKDSTIALLWKDNSINNTFTYTYATSSFSSLPVMTQNASSVDILIGTKNGKLLKLSGSGSGLSFVSVLDSAGLTVPITKVSKVTSVYRFVKQDTSAFTLYSSSENAISAAGIVRDLVVTKTSAGSDQVIILTKGNQFFVFSNGTVASTFTLSQFPDITSFAVFDIKQDGTNYICFQANDRIYAYNYLGNPADNFPLLVSTIGSHECKPSAVKIAGSNATTLLSLTSMGLYANEGISGKKVSGFPLSIAAGNASSPVLFNLNDKLCIGNVDNSGNIFTWQIASTTGQILFTGLQGNNANTGYVGAVNTTNADSRFFPKEKVYNYPNPVNSGKTFIRYYTSENAKINIKIFDIAGDLAAEINSYATGGFENESNWDVSSIQSGAYLARVEATSDSGKKEFVIVKIAVVK